MLTGPLPPAANFGSWTENIEIVDMSDESLVDLSAATEITLILRDPRDWSVWLTLTKTDGDITTPQTGIIQWYVSETRMAGLRPTTYSVIMTVEDADDVVGLINGSISVVGPDVGIGADYG